MQSPPHPPQKPTKYLNLHMNISQIYRLKQQLQSTSYPHYLHLSCDVKIKSYSIFTCKKITKIFCNFLLKKTFAKEKKINKLTNERKRNLFHIKGLRFTEELISLNNQISLTSKKAEI